METIQQVLTALFSGVWSLFSGVEVPGFGVSFAKVAIGFFIIRFSLSLLSLVTGFRSGGTASDEYRISAGRSGHYRAVKGNKTAE